MSQQLKGDRMCFSTETSLIAGTILTIAGVVLVKRFYNRRELFLALIPLFFGVQQLAESALWYTLTHGTYPSSYSLAAQYMFLFFAKMFWPVWIPLAFAVVEKMRWRQIVMEGLLFLGSLFFFYFGYNFLVYGDVQARIVGHCIEYGRSPLSGRIFYGIITMTPFLLSSIPKMWILGVLNTIAFIVADISYNNAFISIWCGACAIITIGLFIILQKNQPKSQ